MLALMCANIATLSRVRRTHARFSTLQAEPDSDPDAPPSHNLYLPGSAGPAHPPEPDVDAELGAGDTGEVWEAEAERLADEAKDDDGGATQQGPGGTSDVPDGTSNVSITEPNGMSGVSNTSMGTVANEKDDWSHLTALERYTKKVEKFVKEKEDDERAELVKEVEQQLADEAKAAEEAASV
ncbi:hypothetical protein FIBSPDRAFT_380777 [Athelia psychrophila]|uniref:Uncharacterized protein n=1 Tax=Athelia psychrophila TaxID=1759441 RepID=A0A167VDT4_9AGAM|nr:hypothetical protein FIBSPDRAFT_380777 [Fibularhizoctonia sp. CBS 109695]